MMNLFIIIPLLPCLPASLSPTSILRVIATYTLILFFTPGIRRSPDLESSITISITFHSLPDGRYNDVSFTFFDLSPKTAWISFSSAESSHSDLGVILPTKISPPFTTEPIRTIPFSSKSFNFARDTHGISLVVSSAPSLVSATSISYCSICTDLILTFASFFILFECLI